MRTPFASSQSEEESARIRACPKPDHVRRMTTPAEGDRCAECYEALEARLVFARAHPKVIAANAASDAAWRTYQDRRNVPTKERHELEKAWRAASDLANKTFSDICAEYKEK